MLNLPKYEYKTQAEQSEATWIKGKEMLLQIGCVDMLSKFGLWKGKEKGLLIIN